MSRTLPNATAAWLLVIASCFADGFAKASHAEEPAPRPHVVAVLKSGARLEGTLEQFLDGEYWLLKGDQRAKFREREVATLIFTFTAEQPSPEELTALRNKGNVRDVPELAAALQSKHRELRAAALYGLYNIGIRSGNILPETLTPLLIDALQDSFEHNAQQAAQVLGMVARPPDKIVPALIAVLRDEKRSNISTHAVLGLGRLAGTLRADDPLLDEVTTALITALDHPLSGTRTCAAQQLGHFGKRGLVAVPALRKACDDAEPFVRRTAREAIYSLGSYPSEAVTPAGFKNLKDAEVVAVLAGEDTTARHAARTELNTRQPTRQLAELLMQAVREDKDNQYWNYVSHVFSDWQDQAAALGLMEKYSTDNHFRVRRATMMALGAMRPEKIPAWAGPRIHDENHWVRLTALEALCNLTKSARGKQVKVVTPFILQGMRIDQEWRDTWRMAAYALERIGAQHPDVIPALIEFLHKSPHEQCRSQAVSSLVSIARPLRDDHADFARIVAALAESVESESVPTMKRTVLSYLKLLGPRAAAAIPAVARATDNPDTAVAKEAAETLAAIKK